MSLSPEALENHCQQILSDSRINDRIVVLCEGNIINVQGPKSPKTYKEMEQMPDANFYKKCVPKSWSKEKKLPQFFNCGDRKDVIDTYFHLLELHDVKASQSYLNKSKLFALIDLDIQLQKIDNYHFSDTEEIFCNLYKQTKVIQALVNKHIIWITGLIHKEAYFITPEIQEVFDCSLLYPQYQTNPVLLENIYLKICNDITQDIDLQNNFDRVINRINYCQYINCCDVESLKDTWSQEFINSSDKQRKKELVLLLLTIRKAKKYWKQIEPNSDWTKSSDLFREQLSLKIGEFYSKQDWNNPENHIAFFFKTLYEFA